MNKTTKTAADANPKKEAIFSTSVDVFAQYGYRRTTMNDLAEAAGISRPALYLLFDNKENLFRELTAKMLDGAIEQAALLLSGNDKIKPRFIDALLAFEKAYYEPVSNSPHGAELMDTNLTLATDVMMQGFSKLVTAFATVLTEAEETGEVSFKDSTLTPTSLVELLFAAIGGVKKKAASTEEFRKKTEQLAVIFLDSIIPE